MTRRAVTRPGDTGGHDHGDDHAHLVASGVTALAGAAGLASILACGLLAPAVLQPAEGLSLAAPWLAAAVAVSVGALVLRARQARACRTASPRRKEAFVGPDVAALALPPLVAGLGTWFAVACGLPLCATAWSDERRVETLAVVARGEAGGLPCRYPLVLAGGPLAHPVQGCVDRDTWATSTPGGALTVEVLRGPLALELRAPAGAR